MSEEALIDVPEVEEKPDVEDVYTVSQAREDGVSEQEISMGLKSGVIKDVEPEEEVQEEKPEEVVEEVKDQEENPSENLDPKDSDPDLQSELNEIRKKIEKGENLNRKEKDKVYTHFDAKELGLFKRAKKEIYKRKMLQSENEYLNQGMEALNQQVEDLKKMNEQLASKIEKPEEDEYLTAAKFKEIQAEEAHSKQVDSKTQELEARKLQMKQERLNAIEEMQKAEDPKFVEIEGLFAQMAQKDASVMKSLEQRVLRIGEDLEAEQDIIDYVYRVAKKHEDYNKIFEKDKEEDKKKAEKLAKNLSRPKSSATISGSGVLRKAEDDLDVDDVSRLTPNQWRKLRPETRERLLAS